MSSKEILINSNTMKGMEKDVASSTMGIKEVTARDYETTIAGNANSIECYETCNNVVTAMNNALNRNAKKLQRRIMVLRILIIKLPNALERNSYKIIA